MRKYASPALCEMRIRLRQFASEQGGGFIAALLQANAEFLAYAFSSSGPLHTMRHRLNPQGVRSCLASMLIYSVNLFARGEMANNDSELVSLLSQVLEVKREALMIRRDALRKSPRSEEWLVYTWLFKDLGLAAPKFDPDVEQSFGYQYLSYIGQYKKILEKNVPSSEP